jgi:hypothetical protein
VWRGTGTGSVRNWMTTEPWIRTVSATAGATVCPRVS